nr:putative B3 domain-containing protein At1g78640 [Ipomoea batatas]
MESLVCSTTRRVEDDDPQAGVIPPLSAASVWCSNDDVHPYPYQESPLVLALPVPNHHDQEEITKLTLFTGSEEDHPTAAPRIEDHLPIKKRKRFIILGSNKPKNNSIQVDHPNTLKLIGAASSFSLSLFPPTKKINIGPKKPIKNHHRGDDELIDAASSLSLSLPTTKRKRPIIIGPKSKKPENSSVQEKEEEGVIIAKRQKKKIRSAEGVVDSCSSNYVINRTYENNGYAGTVGAGAPGVAEQIDEQQSDWAYSKPVVILVWNFAFSEPISPQRSTEDDDLLERSTKKTKVQSGLMGGTTSEDIAGSTQTGDLQSEAELDMVAETPLDMVAETPLDTLPE